MLPMYEWMDLHNRPQMQILAKRLHHLAQNWTSEGQEENITEFALLEAGAEPLKSPAVPDKS